MCSRGKKPFQRAVVSHRAHAPGEGQTSIQSPVTANLVTAAMSAMSLDARIERNRNMLLQNQSDIPVQTQGLRITLGLGGDKRRTPVEGQRLLS